jgi:hypothetical protein
MLRRQAPLTAEMLRRPTVATLRRRTAQLIVGMQARWTAVTPGAQRMLPIAAADTAPSVKVQVAAERRRLYNRAPVLSGR